MSVSAPASEVADFTAWAAERRHIEARLDHAPEATHAAEREELLSRLALLEQLILNTECLELPALREKARLLEWLMEMEQADGLLAMRHISAYFEIQR